MTVEEKDLVEKFREDVLGSPSIEFTREAIADETFVQKSINLCKSIVGIGASQLYLYSMCQSMLSGLCTHWDLG